MTTLEVLKRVERDRPGESTREEMLRWLSQLDSKWYEQMILTHEGSEDVERPEPYDEGVEAELLIPAPYDEVYIHHLYSKIDYRLGEIDRYNNSAMLFNEEWQEARKAYHRAHKPLRTVIDHVVYGYGARHGDDPLNLGV
ncbi:MAG: hypothetical protein E7316_02280 [Clostridiales bacterium]|nr:hypothetical protein [Clostridiales bacterium]